MREIGRRAGASATRAKAGVRVVSENAKRKTGELLACCDVILLVPNSFPRVEGKEKKKKNGGSAKVLARVYVV